MTVRLRDGRVLTDRQIEAVRRAAAAGASVEWFEQAHGLARTDLRALGVLPPARAAPPTLTDAQRGAIRRAHANGASLHFLAKCYGVSRATLREVAREGGGGDGEAEPCGARRAPAR